VKGAALVVGITFGYNIVLLDRKYAIGEIVEYDGKNFIVRALGKNFLVFLEGTY
jgi:hypothetical protein